MQWLNIESKTIGTAIYTSSWISPKTDTHTQQKFFYVGHNGEINIDQAHRGYSFASDTSGLLSINPLYMKLVPTDGSLEFDTLVASDFFAQIMNASFV